MTLWFSLTAASETGQDEALEESFSKFLQSITGEEQEVTVSRGTVGATLFRGDIDTDDNFWSIQREDIEEPFKQQIGDEARMLFFIEANDVDGSAHGSVYEHRDGRWECVKQDATHPEGRGSIRNRLRHDGVKPLTR